MLVSLLAIRAALPVTRARDISAMAIRRKDLPGSSSNLSTIATMTDTSPASTSTATESANATATSIQPGPSRPSVTRLSSEDLEDLEDTALLELQETDDYDEEIDTLWKTAAVEYPPEKVLSMRKDLRRLGPSAFVAQEVTKTTSILNLLSAFGVLLPKTLRGDGIPREVMLPILITALHRVFYTREKLQQYNTISDALHLLRESKPNSVVVLSGAGISTSCGIPDFRSENGIYARLQRNTDFNLDDPADMFDKEVFLARPELFYAFAKDIYPSNFKPSPAHRFIKLLEDQDRLLRNYTQNIDTLEQVAGIKKVLNCHGSFATASCVTCGHQVPGASIKEDIFAERVPSCPRCNDSERPKKRRRKDDSSDDENDDGTRTGIMKPDIVFFGEKLSDDFDHALIEDREKASLLIVIGSSLSVAPVSKVVGHLPHSTPTILINRAPIRDRGLDIVLLGYADFIVEWLSHRLGWQLPKPQPDKSVVGEASAISGASTPSETPSIDVASFEPERVGERYVSRAS